MKRLITQQPKGLDSFFTILSENHGAENSPWGGGFALLAISLRRLSLDNRSVIKRSEKGQFWAYIVQMR